MSKIIFEHRLQWDIVDLKMRPKNHDFQATLKIFEEAFWFWGVRQTTGGVATLKLFLKGKNFMKEKAKSSFPRQSFRKPLHFPAFSCKFEKAAKVH